MYIRLHLHVVGCQRIGCTHASRHCFNLRFALYGMSATYNKGGARALATGSVNPLAFAYIIHLY